MSIVEAQRSARADSATGEQVRMLIDGKWREGASAYDVRDPYRGESVCSAPLSSLADLDLAATAATLGARTAAGLSALERAALLRRASDILEQREEAIADVMVRETGKAIRDSRAEIQRSVETLRLSAEEAVRIEGEHVPLDASANGAGKLAMLLRFPVGVVAAITPYNAPVNLVCHKIGPAFAAGNAVILKAPPQSPLTVHKLIEVFVDAGTPAGMLNVLYGHEVGPALVRDPRVDFISFTGSSRAGAEIRAASGLKRVALELGGNGATIVHSDADLTQCAPMCALNSMRLAGQSCISVQNLYVHANCVDEFTERLVGHVTRLKLGDPLDPRSDIGTLIDEAAAARVESWVGEAMQAGAQVLTGGRRHGAAFEPTVITNVKPDMKVVAEEVFGPVVTIQSYKSIDDVIDAINASRYGLQCGIFSSAAATLLSAARRLRVGGVILNGTSTWRTDQSPYGGVKCSGIGREGPRYAIRDMTEERFVVFNY